MAFIMMYSSVFCSQESTFYFLKCGEILITCQNAFLENLAFLENYMNFLGSNY